MNIPKFEKLNQLIDDLPEVYQAIYIHDTLIRQGIRKNDFERLEVIKEFIQPGQTILDIGSNAGFFTIQLAKLFPDNVFVSVEANRRYANLQQELLKIEKLENVILINSAITLEWLEAAEKACTYFDVTLLLSVLHHMSNAESFIEKISQISKSLLIEMPHPNESRVCGKEVLSNQLKIERIKKVKPIFKKLDYESTTHCDSNLKRSFYYADSHDYERTCIFPYIGYPLPPRDYIIQRNRDGLTIYKKHLDKSIQAIPGVILSDIEKIGRILYPLYDDLKKQISENLNQLDKLSNVSDIRPWNLLYTSKGLQFIDFQYTEDLARQLMYNRERDEKIINNYLKSIYDRRKHKPICVIDGVFFQLYKAGVSRVWNSLLEEWIQSDFAQHIVVLDRAGTSPIISGIRFRLIPPYNYNNIDRDREMLQEICNEEEADIFISTLYTTPISTPSVFIAYDMIPEVMGANLNSPIWQAKHYAINYASAYAAISQNTAQDLVKFFPNISLESVTVAHCGVSQTFSPASLEEISNFKTKYGITKPYFLLVSTGGGTKENITGYKNTILFFQAFSQLFTRQGFEILCTGSSSPSGLADEIRSYTAGTVVHMLELTDAELKLAYSGAVALVYPSKYEGFGLPIVEAMACGCPVITCANASIPEVADSAALYVNPDDVDELTNALCDIQKLEMRNQLISAGLEQAKKFSWSAMAQQVRSVLIDTTLLYLNLKQVNVIIFPDWSQPEESWSSELTQVILSVMKHPNSSQMALLIDTTDISQEEANLAISSMVMNIFMEEDLELTEEPAISAIEQLGELQWQALLPRIHGRIVLEYENQEAIASAKAEDILCWHLENFCASRAVKSPTGIWELKIPDASDGNEFTPLPVINENSDLSSDYWRYLEQTCPNLDRSLFPHIISSLKNTSWDQPNSALDFNNVAVVSLIEAENCQDSSMKEIYLEMAFEALNEGVEEYNHPLCAAHLALLLIMSGDLETAIPLVFSTWDETIQAAYVNLAEISPSIVYLPSRSEPMSDRHNLLVKILGFHDGYTQSLFLLREAIKQLQITSLGRRDVVITYTKKRLQLLEMAVQGLNQYLWNYLINGFQWLHQNLSIGLLNLQLAQYSPICSFQMMQAICLMSRDAGEQDLANFWRDFARHDVWYNPDSLEWRWTNLAVNHPRTYIPFEKEWLLVVEATCRSMVTSILLSEGDWFEKEMEFWRDRIQPGMTVIDVGANVGVYTFSAASCVGETGVVLAIEPFADCVECLEETCQINQISWVKICAGAASDRNGKARLSLSSSSELNAIANPDDSSENINPDSYVEIPCFTLDSLIEQENLDRVDFIKIDAEGHELSVLIGSEQILSQFSPVILYENIAGSQGSNLPVADYLRSHGYQLFRYQPDRGQLIPISDPTDNLSSNLNIIAVPAQKSNF